MKIYVVERDIQLTLMDIYLIGTKSLSGPPLHAVNTNWILHWKNVLLLLSIALLKPT